MSEQNKPNIVIEKISPERIDDIYDVFVESGKEWFAAGMISKPDQSIEELETTTMKLLKHWEGDTYYMFSIIDVPANQLVGFAFLNHINRQLKMANLGYQVRNSRTGEGIATEAAKQVARYGFDELGFQRIEIVVLKDNIPSQKVAEKLGAVREGLLRNRYQINGSAVDAYMYSVIPSDFEIYKTA